MLFLRRAAPVLLIALFVWMSASVTDRVGTTVDEVPHLTAGYAYWKTGDYRFQPENGNFPQRWAAAPLLLRSPAWPEQTAPGWQNADVWKVGHWFFFHGGNDPARLLAHGRLMIALLGGATLALVYFWAAGLFGARGGLFALGIATFCPHLLAHGGLVTSDMAAALGFLAATLAWWRLCHRISVGRVLAAGVAFGLLALAKFSAALFVPMAIGIALVRLTRAAPLPVRVRNSRVRLKGGKRWLALLGAGLAAAAVALAMIWAAFGFRYSATPDGAPATFAKSWDDVLLTDARPDFELADGSSAIEADANLKPGIVQRFVTQARAWRVLPEAYLYGLAFVDRHARARLAYFAGEYRSTGWPEFFPAAFILKTTLPALLALAFATVVVLRTAPRRRLWYRLLPLFVVMAVYVVFSISSALNIGHRHLLPMYPLLYILSGALGLAKLPRTFAALALGLLTWQAVEAIRIRPHYLSYFNAIAGGPENGARYFVDSSLDWGQDLPALKSWLDANAGAENVFLSYFGSDSPAARGIKAVRVGDMYFDSEPRQSLPIMTGGIYCISATMMSRVYTRVRGPWTEGYDRAYQELTAWLRHLNRQPKGRPPVDIEGNPVSAEELERRLVLLEQLRFARLCHLIQSRAPAARAGYSISIYRLSDDEVTFALQAPLPLLNAAIAATAASAGP